MQGFIVREFGGPENMHWEELRDPVPGPNQILVDVKASGINFAETRMRAGTYGGQEIPFVMGMEGAGIVDAVGSDVAAFKPGDRVFGRARGCHAEKVLFAADHLMPLPDNLSFVEGAAIPVGWLTAWHALITVARLQEGARVLIEAVASSVGSAALKIAKWKNCWVAGTASQDEKLHSASEAGADLSINYKKERVSERVLAATDNQGVDVGLMTIGQETAEQLFDSMGMDGKVVMYGSTSGKQVCFDLVIGSRNIQLLSMSISTSSLFVPESMKTFRDVALPLFADGTFEPVVGHVLPVSKLVKAHEMVNERAHYGKIILELS